jgi:RNA recognition motif-containing protein
MSRGTTGNKRDREAKRDRRKLDKADRLQRNRDDAARERPGTGDDGQVEAVGPQSPPPVDLADVATAVPADPAREPLTLAKLFVGGLSHDMTPDELRIAFSNFGRVTDTKVVRDPSSGRSRGFGFVTFEKWADADEAIKQMHDRELDGRRLKVNRAEPS